MDNRKKEEITNNDLQNTTQTTKDRANANPTKTGGEFKCSGRVSNSCFTRGTFPVT